MAVTTKILFPATSNNSTTDFSLSGLQLNNQDDLDVYVTKTTAGIAANNNKRILHFRQSTSSNVDANHNQVNNTDGLYFPAITHTGGTETLENYTLVSNNSVVRFNSALPNGAIVFVERRTRDADSAYTSFASGSTIRATDLNNSSTESNFTAQEARNKALTIEGVLFDGDQPSTNFVTSSHIVDGSIVNADINASANIAGSKLANDSVTLDKLGSGALPTDITVASANIVDGTIVEADLSNSAITANKIADGTVGTLELSNGAVNTAKLAADAVDGTKLADNAVDSEHYTDGSIDEAHLSASAVTENKIADGAVAYTKLASGSVISSKIAGDAVDGTKIADDSIDSEHIAAGALDNEHYAAGSITSDKLNGATVITSSEQGSATTNDTSFLTSAAADARFFNISSGDTIKDGQAFPDNDTTIATTAAINDRIIDIVNDVGGFDIVESEQHFPNTNPQGQAGSAAVLSIKAASTNLVPSGTTLTITNGNLANNANITITGVTSTIPSGFGFIVESTNTLHTYTFHRLVPKATEVTTVAGKATEIGRLGTAAAVEDMSILGTTDVVADMAILGTNDVVADMNLLATSDVISDMNTLAVADVLSDLSTVADSATNVNNVGNNITNVNSVSNSAGANQTFTVTVQNVSGNKYFIDGVQTPVLKLARGKTYTFDMSDSSNSSHPLAFRDSSDNSYTTGVTTSGTAGSSGATVVFAVPSNAPSSLKYYCTSHGNNMGNTITVIDDNVGIVAGSITNVNEVGDDITNVNSVATSITNVNTVASNISNVNSFFNVYRIGQNNPTTSLDVGDLFFNTTSNSLKVYTGSAWVDGVTATGNFAVVTGNTFTGSNNHNDNVKSIYGASNDLQIYHDGSNSYIDNYNGTGNLFIRGNGTNAIVIRPKLGEDSILALSNGAVKLYYDFSKKLETTSSGVDVIGEITASSAIISGNVRIPLDNTKLQIGASQDLELFHNGSASVIRDNGTGNLQIAGSAIQLTNNAIDENMFIALPNGAVELYYDNSKKFQTENYGTSTVGDIYLTGNLLATTDTSKLLLGGGNDLQIYHDGSNSYIDNHTGDLNIRGNGDDIFLKPVDTEVALKAIPNGAVELYYNNNKKLETDNSGVTITGRLETTSNVKAKQDGIGFRSGAGDDLQIFHDGTDSFVQNNTGQLILRTATTESAVVCKPNGAAELYYDNSKKLETTSTGVHVLGTLEGDNLKASNPGNNALLIQNPSNGIIGFGANNQTNQVIITTDGHLGIPNDTGKLRLGSGEDLQIYHDSSDSYIDNSTGNLNLRVGGENGIRITPNASVNLYYNNNQKLNTANGGVEITGTCTATSFSGDGSNLSGINTDLVSDTSPQLGGNLDTNSFEIDLDDGHGVRFGDQQDMQMYHTGTAGYWTNNTGNTIIAGNAFRIYNQAQSEDLLQANNGGAVNLYYDNSRKLSTHSEGVTIPSGNGLTINGGTGNRTGDAVVYVDKTNNNDWTMKLVTNSGSSSDYGLTINGASSAGYLLNVYDGSSNVFRVTGGGTLHAGHVSPRTNNTFDLGGSSARWRNVYTNDLHLSNEGSSNDVDGTWGDWTIQEGESDLFLKNNRSGKKYKFNLMEVS